MRQLTYNQTQALLRQVAKTLLVNEGYLGEIDQAIGDGDHGIGMANGARAILSLLDQLAQDTGTINDSAKKIMEESKGAIAVNTETKKNSTKSHHSRPDTAKQANLPAEHTIGKLFQNTGMAMMESMGGASGIIFSSVFLGIGQATSQTTTLTVKQLSEGVQAAVNLVQKRGQACLGDKTMLDALIPAADALVTTSQTDLVKALKSAVQAAWQGVERTKEYPAKFGRAKFLGERSVGWPDAGATSVALIFEAMQAYCEEEAA